MVAPARKAYTNDEKIDALVRMKNLDHIFGDA